MKKKIKVKITGIDDPVFKQTHWFVDIEYSLLGDRHSIELPFDSLSDAKRCRVGQMFYL